MFVSLFCIILWFVSINSLASDFFVVVTRWESRRPVIVKVCFSLLDTIMERAKNRILQDFMIGIPNNVLSIYAPKLVASGQRHTKLHKFLA